jgi:predicted XRE-type DNA-binding protein
MINVTKGSTNIFEDLGFDTPEAINLKIRADLMLDLRQFIQDRKWTQAEAALFFGETQPRISNLMNGDSSNVVTCRYGCSDSSHTKGKLNNSETPRIHQSLANNSVIQQSGVA